MKTLSVRQPYADKILTGAKTREHRSWYTHHRGPLAIHAGTSTNMLEPFQRADARKGVSPYVFGAVVGIVDLIDCVPHEGKAGGYHWLLANPRRFTEPIPLKGRLGLFDVEIQEELWTPPAT